jgi:exodeoxyribonuclease VII large subunit
MQTDLFEQHEDRSEIWNVSDLTRKIKRVVETGFRTLWVSGEISNLRAHPSGHRYFVLKDNQSQLKAVLFRGDASALGHMPQEGEECLAYGELTVYEPRGEYQLRVRHMMQDGMGNMRMQFERLKEQLLKEGLFDDSRKKTLPSLPQKVAIITSASGAVLQDLLSILKRRAWNGSIYLFNSPVQGKDAPESLLKALERAVSFPDIDLIVVARGGGSIEDLWAFNDEQLVRQIAECPIPTISAIGHQTDFVLTDFSADFRAETPSAAAEWISSEHLRLAKILEELAVRLKGIPEGFLSRASERIQLDETRLTSCSPTSRIERQHQFLDDLQSRMIRTIESFFEKNSYVLRSLGQRLEGSSLNSTLRKGFAYLKDEDGKIIDLAKDLKKGSKVLATLQDGNKRMKVEG